MKQPRLHFSQNEYWMNDPNGLIKINDVYHLFFQSNPYDKNWGNIGWGHAISYDLVKWEKQDEALYANDKFMIFSGSAISSNNILGMNEELIAFYTSCEYYIDENKDFIVKKQTQNIAYSDISGIEWKMYPNNPILDINSTEFRDPKVIKLNENQWLMLVTRSRDFEIDFYLSNDLLDWSLYSSFSDCGFKTGAWECPDLIEVSLNGIKKYVLSISIDNGFKSGGSGVLYIIGDLDDGCFIKDSVLMDNQDYQILDKGPDFFATQSFYNEDIDEPPTIIGWLNNWKYAKEMPSKNLPLLQSIPRQLSLVSDINNKALIRQLPILNIEKYVHLHSQYKDILLKPILPIIFNNVDGSFVYNAKLDIQNDTSFKIVASSDSHIAFSVELTQSFSRIDVMRETNKAFELHTNHFHTNFTPLNKVLDIKIIMDYFSVEIFINDFTEVFSMHLGRFFSEVNISTLVTETPLLLKSISVSS